MTDYSFLIPQELRDTELFQLVLFLLGEIETVDEAVENDILDSLLLKVFSDYEDLEAVMSYFNIFIRPQLGTWNAMNSIIRMVGINGGVTEWFETGDAAFEFGVDVIGSIPSSVDVPSLIELMYLIKNERSWLVAMHIIVGSGMLIWDEGQWSNDCYSSPFGGGTVAANHDLVEISYP